MDIMIPYKYHLFKKEIGGFIGASVHSELDHLLPPIVHIRYFQIWLGRLHHEEISWILAIWIELQY